jgi:glycosyltransferase involved in cell wall biosynthesis
MESPYFSIIVVSFNAENLIEKTIESIINQTFHDYEIIIKDGCSKDNTIYNVPKNARIVLYSESDNGIYDAMNYAIIRSKGKYILFLNCGDYFNNCNVLFDVYNATKNYNGDEIVYGDYKSEDCICKQATNISDFYLYRTPLCHQTMFITRKLFSCIGLYDCSLKILADYDHTIHCWKEGITFYHINVIVCNYLGGGVSESIKGTKIKEIERNKLIKKYYNKSQRFKYDFILVMSLRKFRIWLFSGHCPQPVKNIYRKLVNYINEH